MPSRLTHLPCLAVLMVGLGPCSPWSWCEDQVAELTQQVATLTRELAETRASSVSYHTLDQFLARDLLTIWQDDGPTPALVQVLNLDDAQATAVRTIIRATRAALVAAVKAHSTLVTNGATQTLRIEDFSASGAILRQGMEQRLTAVMGPDRTAYLATLSSAEDQYFLYFGKGRLEIAMSNAHGLQHQILHVDGDDRGTESGAEFPREFRCLASLFSFTFVGSALARP